MSTAPTPTTQPVKTKSKAYSSTVAIQGDAAKYRLKYKELKKKVREIEVENDKLHLKTLRIKRNIQRMRLERAILYERLEVENRNQNSITHASGAHLYEPPSSTPVASITARVDDPYRSETVLRADYAAEYPSYHAAPSVTDHPPPPPSAASGYRQLPHGHGHAHHAAARTHYGYENDYAPLPPAPHGHGRVASGQYGSRHHSPILQGHTAAPASMGDRAERLRQYTPSVSPEPTLSDAADPNVSVRSSMNATHRRGV